jgi:hypothetical protein
MRRSTQPIEATMNERELSPHHQENGRRRFEFKDILATIPFLNRQKLVLDEASLPWILKHIDLIVSRSRGNRSIKKVYLYPYSANDHDYEVWDKVGRTVGNLQGLKTLCIASYNYLEDEDDEDLPIVDWEIVTRILRHVRQSMAIDITGSRTRSAEEFRLFAGAIHGHPTITCFEDKSGDFPYESLDAVYSALATLPALEFIILSRRRIRPEDESALAHPESLTKLLRITSLQSVGFDSFYFTTALCQATANALMEGTAIINLMFKNCAFSAEGSAAIMANGLTRNTSVSYIEVESPFDGTLDGALAAALPLNSTLRDLVLSGRTLDDDSDYSPVFFTLGNNTGLNILTLGAFGSMDESLSTAMKDGLGMNETLESRYSMTAFVTKTPLCGAGRFPSSAPTRRSNP